MGLAAPLKTKGELRVAQRIGPEMFAEADKTTADIEQEVTRGIPEAIPIITGGYKTGAVPSFGPEILVEVIDTLDPSGSAGFVPVGCKTRKNEWRKKVPLNKPFLIPEKIITQLENCIETERRPIQMDSQLYANKALAEATNPGMTFKINGEGDCWLERRTHRYIVRRVSPVEMRTRN